MNKLVTVEDSSIPQGAARLIMELPPPSQLSAADTVTLKFGHAFVYLTGLVILAAWRKALPDGVVVKIDDDACEASTRHFLTNTGFREVIQTGAALPSIARRIGKVPIQPIVRGWEKEATVGEIIRIFDDYAGQVADSTPFRLLLSELCENVLAHSRLTTPGYICARVLEQVNRCEIAIADTGIGIEESFRQGSNTQALARMQNGESALEIAFEGLSSSKPDVSPVALRSHYGYGLYVTRRLVEANGGRLMVISGRQSLTIEQGKQDLQKLARPWQGTFVGIVLELVNPLPLDEIYGEFEKQFIVPAAESLEKAGTLQISVPAEQPEVVRINISNYGSQLLTREIGTAIRADIASLLAAGKRVVVGLDGIEDVTPSCADEAFGKLAEMIGFTNFEGKVTFDGGQALANRLVQFVLKARQRPK